jgi:putative ABC transport system permease protein
VALWANAALSSRLLIAGKPFELSLDWRVAGFAFAAALVSAVFFGLLPALLASRIGFNETLKQGGRGSTSSHHRVRHALIVIEVALALVLLSGAGFFLRGLDRFLARDHGWQTANLLTATVTLPDSKYPNDAAKVAFHDRLETRLGELPGVNGVALSRTLPFRGFGWGQRYIVEGQPLPEPGAEPHRDVNGVNPGYFETMGIALVAGRTFTRADLTGPVRTVISESMARNLWPGESALGKRIAHPLDPTNWQEVIGVVRDVGFASNLDSAELRFQTYRLFAREPDNEISVALRCATDPAALAGTLRQAVAALDSELVVTDIRPATLAIEQQTANYALTGLMLASFATLGLLLAAIGLYGVISGFVAQRTNEIGIRMALGAQWRDVLHLVLGQGLRLTALGTLVGLAGVWWVASLLRSMVPALPPSEPLIAAGITLLLVLTALLACWIPARRATKVDPMVALRAE